MKLTGLEVFNYVSKYVQALKDHRLIESFSFEEVDNNVMNIIMFRSDCYSSFHLYDMPYEDVVLDEMIINQMHMLNRSYCNKYIQGELK